MDVNDLISDKSGKMRIVQELVPGKFSIKNSASIRLWITASRPSAS